MASIGENANLDKALLKENVNKIEGLQSQVSEINYDLTIIVDGYEFKITELGKVTGTGVVNKLPENTPTTDAGTEVAIKDSWGTEAMRVVKTENGEEKEITKVATVYAVSGGEGETVPVPYGFYYVGGTVNSGVVISDNAKDKNKYVGQEDVGKDLEGNQFVWIPCNIENYKKYNWGYANNSFDTRTNVAEETQIIKYDGFYVGRYEAGTSEVTLKDGKKIGDEKIIGMTNDCYVIDKVTAESKPTTKANEIPYNHVNVEIAEIMSRRMYNTNYVHSGLITGTQWDVMINFMSDEIDKSEVNASDASKYTDLKTNCTWGNYYNTTINNCGGKYCLIDGNGSMVSDWEENVNKTNNNSGYRTLLTTGSTEEVKKKNLYDVAGNLYEFVQETAVYSGVYSSLRSGSFWEVYGTAPACFRGRIGFNSPNTDFGFRPVLYIK